jgi:ATP-dependent DNA helicase RecQ
MTKEAKWVINCVAETRGRYGLAIVLGTLLGANRARLKELGTVNYKSYGALKEHSEAELRTLISQMLLDGYLYQTDGKYSVLRMGDITPLRKEDTHVIIRTFQAKEPERKQKTTRKRSTDSLTGAGYELFERLRSLRLEIAKEAGVPPYIVFNDKTLIDMCEKLPANREEMLNVSGVGAAKYEKYGARFIDEIQNYQENHPDTVVSIKDFDIGDISR